MRHALPLAVPKSDAPGLRLLLSAGDTEHLAPGAVARLVREAILSAVRHALTTA